MVITKLDACDIDSHSELEVRQTELIQMDDDAVEYHHFKDVKFHEQDVVELDGILVAWCDSKRFW